MTAKVLTMALTDAERARRYRDRKRGGPPAPRELRPHGTPAAYRRHERAGDVAAWKAGTMARCEPCVTAEQERQHQLYLNRAAQAG